MICPKCHQSVEYLFFTDHCHRCRDCEDTARAMTPVKVNLPARCRQHADPETQSQLDELSGDASFRLSCARWSTALMFALLLLWSSLAHRLWPWLNWRRECAWCKRRIGGNPIAYAVTHGICAACLNAETQRAQRNAEAEENLSSPRLSASSAPLR